MTSDRDLHILLELLAPQAGERVLDLGCGAGRLTVALDALGCRVTALDREVTVFELLTLVAPDAERVCLDARDYQPAQPFDAVAALGILHWLDSPLDGARLLYRLLTEDGRAAGLYGGDGAAPLEAAELRAAFRLAGFADVEVEQYEGRLWFFAGRRASFHVA